MSTFPEVECKIGPEIGDGAGCRRKCTKEEAGESGPSGTVGQSEVVALVGVEIHVDGFV